MFITVCEDQQRQIRDLEAYDSKGEVESALPGNATKVEDRYDQARGTRQCVARYESSNRTFKVFRRVH